MERIDFSDRNVVFILGVERSGSTWLSNIFDASPDVEAYMEPFAEVPNLFKGFPGRLTYIDQPDARLEGWARDRLGELREYKYFGLESPDSPPVFRRLNWNLQTYLEEFSGAAGIAQIPGRTRYRQLNLNRIGNPETRQFEKWGEPDFVVFKELRLNFKIPFIREVFPEARYVVIVRNPLAQVDSMMRLLDEGSLPELGGVLDSLNACLLGQKRMADFEDSLRDLGDDRLSRAVAYWFVNYSILLEDLEATDARYELVRHEDLCQRPEETARDLLRSVGIDWRDQVQRYVEHSSTGSSDADAPTDTTRDSKSYVRQRLREIAEHRRAAVADAAEGFWQLAPTSIAEYRDWLADEWNENASRPWR